MSAFPDAETRYLLDTNVLRELVLGSDKVYDIEARYGLLVAPPRMVWVPYVVRAELTVLGRNWNNERQANFSRILARFSEISRFDAAVFDAYVEIDSFSRDIARVRMGENDLWIAATALVHNFTILTNDRDFSHLAGLDIAVAFVELATAGVADDR